MWKSKKNIVLAAVLAVVVLLGATAGIAIAQNGNSPKTGQGNELFARVAQILGIDQQKLTDAFKQARDEFIAKNPRPQRPALQNHDEWLAQLVKDGKLTQQQADQYRQWLKSKPNVPVPFLKGPRMFQRFPLQQQEAPNNQSLQNWSGNSNII